jgi:DNA-binding NtrC family response regulator
MSAKQVLIVDDDQRMTYTLTDILAAKGYSAHPAHTGEKALQLAREKSFDCVISDIKMPGMNGVELFQAYRQLHPDTPIILMTAYAPGDLLTSEVSEKVVAVLRKPFDIDLVLTFLSAL